MAELSNILRPQRLEDLIGQDINKAIMREWIEKGLPNSIILYGRSGCGKTTTARILATETGAEYLEFDAASNGGVEDAKRLNELASRLSLTNSIKIFCIDEAHSLSNQAWQTLLKTIEEPNDRVHFIFCTTEYTKLPNTIKGRSRMLKFYSLERGELEELSHIAMRSTGVTLSTDIVDLCIERSKGQARDLLKLIQSATELNPKNEDDFRKFLGIPDRNGMTSYIKGTLGLNPKVAIKVLKLIVTDILEWCRELENFIYELIEDKFQISELSGKQLDKIREIRDLFSLEDYGKLLTELIACNNSDTAYTILYSLALRGVR